MVLVYSCNNCGYKTTNDNDMDKLMSKHIQQYKREYKQAEHHNKSVLDKLRER